MPQPSDAELSDLAGRLTLEEKVRVLTGKDAWSLHPLPGIGLRSIVVSDGPVGVRGDTWDERSPSVNFPSPTALAASWDREMVREVGVALGQEARRKEVDVLLAPTINLHRTPYGGRHFEAFSEDPVLTAALAAEYVRGVQSQGVAATVKHYVANDSETDRFTVDVRVSDRALREAYLLAFEEPVREAKSWLVMSAYNAINGATASENLLLATPLTDEWGFDGVVISDWTAVRSVNSARHEQHLAMPGPDGAWGDVLLSAVREGEISEEAIDNKVVRILRLASRVGALGESSKRKLPVPAVSADDVARVAASAGMVLLKNNDVLPLGDVRSVALIGEGARDARTQGGGSATVIPNNVVSPLSGVRLRWPDADVAWEHGAIVDTRPSDLRPGTFFTDSGTLGMTVTYTDGAGGLLMREQRQASGIVSFEGDSWVSRSAAVEMAFTYRSADAESGQLAISGVCDFELRIDDDLVGRGEVRTAPGADLAAAVLAPPFRVVDAPGLRDGARVVVRFLPGDGAFPDAVALRVGRPAPRADGDALIADAAALAAASDIAVVVVSTSAEVDSEGFDRTSLSLPGRQDDLVRAVVQANPRTVVIVNSGAPVVLPWARQVPAILATWFPGQEVGSALADVLSGDREPGGRLPVTWPSTEADVPVSNVTPVEGRLHYTEGVHIGYKAWDRAGATPAFAFGHGLGYTDFKIGGMSAVPSPHDGDELEVRVQLSNVGHRSGKAIVQLYVEAPKASVIERPARWLAGFTAAVVPADARTTVSISIPRRRFAYWNDGWEVEPGSYRLTAALAADRPGAALDVTIR